MNKVNGKAAFEIVKAAVESGAIKLVGNTSADLEAAKTRAKADAAYLLTLFSELTEGSKD
ncbi:hypothetical protein GmRootV118_17520 [Variovorax sp. V118]|uniref:hypothetical protein n=1 Tax=Variovorax sp. V118 TaxID=3065954 RepID=UPI0034E874BF